MTMLHLDSNQIIIKQSGGFQTSVAGSCFMADAESLPESDRWAVKMIRGGRKQEECTFQQGQLEGKFAGKEGEMFWKPPMIQTVQIVKITHTHMQACKHSHGCTDTYTHQHAPACTRRSLHKHTFYLFRFIKPQNVQQKLCKNEVKNNSNKLFIMQYPNTQSKQMKPASQQPHVTHYRL